MDSVLRVNCHPKLTSTWMINKSIPSKSWNTRPQFTDLSLCQKLSHHARPPQDVDILAVLDLQITCFRPETPALYPRSLLTNHEGRGHNDNVRDDFRDGNESFKDLGRWGRRRPEEPCITPKCLTDKLQKPNLLTSTTMQSRKNWAIQSQSLRCYLNAFKWRHVSHVLAAGICKTELPPEMSVSAISKNVYGVLSFRSYWLRTRNKLQV